MLKRLKKESSCAEISVKRKDSTFGTGDVRKVKVRGGCIEYEVKGTGEPVVLLRGLARSRRHWMGFDTLLEQDFCVISYNTREISGSTAGASWNLTVEDMASDVIKILDDMCIPRAHILGVSLGGMGAISLGMNYPDRIRSITVCNASVADNELRLPRLTFQGVKALIKGAIWRPNLESHLSRVMLSGITDNDREAVAESWNEIARKDRVSPITEMKQAIAAVRFSCRPKDLCKISVPTLIIYGTDDKLVPIQHSFYLHERLPNSKLRGIKDGGHEITVDHPEEVKSAFVDFLNALPAPVSPQHSRTSRRIGLSSLNWSDTDAVTSPQRNFV